MSYYRDMIGVVRVHLSHQLEDMLLLLEELELELARAKANGIEPYQAAKFQKRLATIGRLIELVGLYDTQVQMYLRFNPENRGDLLERLEVARNYVNNLGGDWSAVVWGKPTDFN
jgi:hypothetical protein